MGLYTAGQVVFLPFPFSDLSQSKLRPVLFVSSSGPHEWIACQITSDPYIDALAVALSPAEFSSGGLRHVSYARPGKLFTAHESLVAVNSGVLTAATLELVRRRIIGILQGPA